VPHQRNEISRVIVVQVPGEHPIHVAVVQVRAHQRAESAVTAVDHVEAVVDNENVRCLAARRVEDTPSPRATRGFPFRDAHETGPADETAD